MRLIFKLLSVMIAVTPVAVPCARPPGRPPVLRPGPDNAAADMQEAVAWLTTLGEAVNEQAQIGRQLFQEMQRLTVTAKSPEQWRASAAHLVELAQHFREVSDRSDAKLAALPPISKTNPVRARVDPDLLLTQARAQLARMREGMGDVIALSEALGAGDAEKVATIGSRMTQVGLTLIDVQRVTFEGRRALFQPTEHPHQLVSFMVLLYKVVGVTERNWLQARTGGDAHAAAGAINREIGEAAKEAASLATQGRANFNRARAAAIALVKEVSDPGERAAAEQALRILEPQARYFDIMDDYAVWALAQPPVTAASLAASLQDPAMLATAEVERHIADLTREVARSGAAGSD